MRPCLSSSSSNAMPKKRRSNKAALPRIDDGGVQLARLLLPGLHGVDIEARSTPRVSTAPAHLGTERAGIAGRPLLSTLWSNSPRNKKKGGFVSGHSFHTRAPILPHFAPQRPDSRSIAFEFVGR